MQMPSESALTSVFVLRRASAIQCYPVGHVRICRTFASSKLDTRRARTAAKPAASHRCLWGTTSSTLSCLCFLSASVGHYSIECVLECLIECHFTVCFAANFYAETLQPTVLLQIAAPGASETRGLCSPTARPQDHSMLTLKSAYYM